MQYDATYRIGFPCSSVNRGVSENFRFLIQIKNKESYWRSGPRRYVRAGPIGFCENQANWRVEQEPGASSSTGVCVGSTPAISGLRRPAQVFTELHRTSQNFTELHRTSRISTDEFVKVLCEAHRVLQKFGFGFGVSCVRSMGNQAKSWMKSLANSLKT